MTTCPTEQAEGEMLWRVVLGNLHAWPELACLYHVPNGGHRARKTAAELARSGVRAGVPDYCLPVPRGGFHGLYVELKRLSGGRTSPEQREWLAMLQAQGYRAVVCRGWEQAWAVIRDYLAADPADDNDED